MLMHGVGDAAEVGDDRSRPRQRKLPRVSTARAMHRHRLDHDHRRAAEGALAVVAEVALAGQPVDAHVGGVGAEDEPVLSVLWRSFRG